MWPSVRYCQDSMDINEFVKVSRVLQKGTVENVSYLGGLAFIKSVMHKKMKLQISTPKILLLKGHTDQLPDCKLAFMDSILRAEDKSQIIIKKVTDIGANLVLMENSMNLDTIRDLAQKNVTCLTYVNQHLMALLARLTGATPIELMGNSPYQSGVLGTCLEFSVVPANSVQLVVLKSERDIPQVATILLFGPRMEKLTKLKRVIRASLTAFRAALLQSSFFLQGHFDPGPNFPFLSRTVLEIHRTTIKDWKCSTPKLIQVKLYGETDVPLGAFIIGVAKEAYEPCEGSEHLLHEHGVFFMHEQGLVQMFTTAKEQRVVDSKEDVMLVRTCTKCGSVRNGKVMLSNRSWEYSFYHFLSNFFADAPKAGCGHSFFKDSVFTFHVRSLSIEFQYVAWPTYDLKPPLLSQAPSHASLKVTRFSQIQAAVATIVANMKNHIQKLTDFLLLEGNFEDKKLQAIRERLETYNERLDQSLSFADPSKIDTFKNFLEVETLRRSIENLLSELNDELTHTDTQIRALTIRRRNLTLPLGNSALSSFATTYRPESTPSAKDFLEVQQDEEVTKAVTYGMKAAVYLEQFQLKVDFTELRQGNLHLPLGCYNVCIPVEQSDPLSIITYSLQTQKYAAFVEPFISSDTISREVMDFELLYGSGKSLTVRFAESQDEKEPIRYKVKVLYARQFQALRLAEGQLHFDFLLSIAHRSEVVATQLGKSSSTFYYSHDGRFILKGVKHREMHMFEDLAPNYFRHMAKHEFHGMPSQLVKTLGAFSIVTKNGDSKTKNCYLLATNLEAMMPARSKVFDLKGTQNARRYVKDGDTRTKMDLNFAEEYHSLPLFIGMEQKQILDAGLWNDTLFLAKQNVIDYSLLVIVSEEDSVIATGIIDYMQHYTVEKAMESKYKTVVGREIPTITDPLMYKTRFREQIMFEYFIGVTN